MDEDDLDYGKCFIDNLKRDPYNKIECDDYEPRK